MKVLYAIQATGNGHLTRAAAIIPCLKKRIDVDVLVSGIHSEVSLPFDIKYHYQGYGFVFGKNGGIDWVATLRKNNTFRFLNEIRKLPVRQYDLVITDFEPVSAWAAFIKGVDCYGIGNQYAINTPGLPVPKEKYPISNWVIKNYTPTTRKYPIFYESLNNKTSLPIIREEIRQMEPDRQGYTLVYLSAIDPAQIVALLKPLHLQKFKVFTRLPYRGSPIENIEFLPVGDESFLQALCHADGVITHSGFGLTSEALFLGKPLFVIPMKGQYEQIYNACFLHERFGIPMANSIHSAKLLLESWLSESKVREVYYPEKTQKWIDGMLSDYLLHKTMFDGRLGKIQTSIR